MEAGRARLRRCRDHLRRLPPFGRSGACVSAYAATLICAFVDFGLRRIFAAFEATCLEVRSFLAMECLLQRRRFCE